MPHSRVRWVEGVPVPRGTVGSGRHGQSAVGPNPIDVDVAFHPHAPRSSGRCEYYLIPFVVPTYAIFTSSSEP